MEQELAQLEAAMSDPEQAELSLARYGKLQADFDHLGGYTYVTRIQQVLMGLGFTPDEFDYPARASFWRPAHSRACWRACC